MGRQHGKLHTHRSSSDGCCRGRNAMPASRVPVSWLRRAGIALALTMLPASTQVARAQDYPSRPITLIVPLVAGGGADTVARILADRMKTTLGQPIVVENIPTGAGTVGVGRLAQAAPDGYTIGIGDQTSNLISSFTTPV